MAWLLLAKEVAECLEVITRWEVGHLIVVIILGLAREGSDVHGCKSTSQSGELAEESGDGGIAFSTPVEEF
jgi:hypothetical protein